MANERADEAEAAREEETTRRQEVEIELQLEKDRLRTLQEKHLGGKNQGQDYLQDDNTIQQNLKTLMGMMEGWAADWSCSGPVMKYLKGKNVDMFLSQVNGSSKRVPDARLRREADANLLWAPLGCRVAVEAFLCMQIVKHVLERPFHFLRNENAGHASPSQPCFEAIHGSMKGTPDNLRH